MLEQILNSRVQIKYEESGKPYLAESDFQISISHTKGFAAVILHPLRQVAVDIEQRTEKVMRLQSKFMNENELSALDSADAVSYSLICWSAKETMFKWTPYTEMDFRKHLCLSSFKVAESGYINACICRNDNADPIVVSYLNRQEYVLTWI